MKMFRSILMTLVICLFSFSAHAAATLSFDKGFFDAPWGMTMSEFRDYGFECDEASAQCIVSSEEKELELNGHHIDYIQYFFIDNKLASVTMHLTGKNVVLDKLIQKSLGIKNPETPNELQSKKSGYMSMFIGNELRIMITSLEAIE